MKYLCLLFLLFPAYCAAQSDSARFVAIDRTLEALVERGAARGLVCDPAGIEDIMLYYLRGEGK